VFLVKTRTAAKTKSALKLKLNETKKQTLMKNNEN